MNEQYLLISFDYRHMAVPLSMELIRALKNPILLRKEYSSKGFSEIENGEYSLSIINSSEITPIAQTKEYLDKQKEAKIESLKSELEKLQNADAI